MGEGEHEQGFGRCGYVPTGAALGHVCQYLVFHEMFLPWNSSVRIRIELHFYHFFHFIG